MKLTGWVLGLWYVSSFLFVTQITTNSSQAQCLQADVATQYNLSSSRQPTESSNNVDMHSNGFCGVNASVTKGLQENEDGTGRVPQQRRIFPRFEGSNQNSDTGDLTVQRSNPQLDMFIAIFILVRYSFDSVILMREEDDDELNS